MTLTTKIMIWFGTILTVGLLSVIVYQQIQINKQQNAIATEMISQKQLIDGIMRSQSTWATKDDVKNLLDANGVNATALSAIQKDMSSINSTLTAANIAVINSQGQVATNIPSTSVGPKNPLTPPTVVNCPGGGTVTCPNNDPFGYQQNEQDLALNEDFSSLKVPIGTVKFNAANPKPWSLDIKPREYSVVNVIGTDDNQRLSVYNKFSVKVDNKQYDIPITTAQTQQIYPTAKWSWFNPRLYAGLDMGVNVNHLEGAITPSANIQVMSYGKYKNQPDFSILQIGGGYNVISKTPELTITPFTYNVGQHIPLMNNLYVGPSIAVGTDGNVLVNLGLRVGL